MVLFFLLDNLRLLCCFGCVELCKLDAIADQLKPRFVA
jgi:hypothetical protein